MFKILYENIVAFFFFFCGCVLYIRGVVAILFFSALIEAEASILFFMGEFIILYQNYLKSDQLICFRKRIK
jgi:hypothetical protein